MLLVVRICWSEHDDGGARFDRMGRNFAFAAEANELSRFHVVCLVVEREFEMTGDEVEDDVRSGMSVWRNTFVRVEFESDCPRTSVFENLCVWGLRQIGKGGDFRHEYVMLGTVCGLRWRRWIDGSSFPLPR